MLLEADRVVLVTVDFQERLLPAMFNGSDAYDVACRLAEVFNILGLPVLATEQYPRGLGSTLPQLREQLSDDCVFEKTQFSCMGSKEFAAKFRNLGKSQVVLAGIESHVCVLQTALELNAAGYDVFVVADGVSSRRDSSVDYALKRLSFNGVSVVTYEMVVFELLGSSDHPNFKEISKRYI